MSDIAIRVEKLSKRYRIGGKKESYKTLRDTLTNGFASPLCRLLNRKNENPRSDHIWALKDVSLDVKRGEVLGIIGRNGAGKSTLLKILSRITEPTEGCAEVYGRAGSLLEVGTGFHPELTGRENIYLNGAILGMKRAEIGRRFDNIVDFAGVDKFVDTPVKHFSTGMYLRLAFAVAAHLEYEILLVDEVLAVGDAGFQKKCLGKMGDVARDGRTILLVSHNMAAIRQMGTEVCVFDEGKVSYLGDPDEAINCYMQKTYKGNAAVVSTENWKKRSGTGKGKITCVGIRDENGKNTANLGAGSPFQISMDLEFSGVTSGDCLQTLEAGVEIKTVDGLPLFNLRSDSNGTIFGPYQPSQRVRIQIDIPGLPLYPGDYALDVWFATHREKRVDHLHEAVFVTIVSQGLYESESSLQPGRGIFLLDCDWSAQSISTEL